MPENQATYKSAQRVRRGTEKDLPRLMEVFRQAREIMRADGNTEQWAGEYPSQEVVLEDIRLGHCFVVEEPRLASSDEREDNYAETSDERAAHEPGGNIVGVFAFIPGVEPTYDKIYEAQFTEGGTAPRLAEWLDDTLPYATIHRLASTRDSRGVAQACFSWAWEQCRRLGSAPGQSPRPGAKAPLQYTLRVDTHADNHIMQHGIQKAGFTYCGIIYLADGSPRLAYQKLP